MTQPQTVYLKEYTAPDYLIDKLDLHIDLGEEYTRVDSVLEIRRQSQVKDLVLDGQALELINISLNEQVLSEKQFRVTEDKLVILTVPDHFTLRISTRLKPQNNTALSGLYKSSGNFCTQCEAQGFRRITYYLDRPDVLTFFTTTIVADKKRYPVLLSNGNLAKQGDLADGRHFVTWIDPFKKPSYLFALVAGDLDYTEDFFETASGKSVTLRIYVEKGNAPRTVYAMEGLKKAMRWDEEVYGREYDLNIYMIVAVSDFNMGAMENKGLNIFNDKYILADSASATDTDIIMISDVIAHEYFHNWTGNRVTCRDWFQLSLKEGLTIFRNQCFTEDTVSKTVTRIDEVNYLRTQQFTEDAGPLAHPVRPDAYIEINNFYTNTVYNKGAEVIRMMHTLLGSEKYRQAMDLYFERHDGQAVTIEEFVQCMEAVSGLDLTQFRLWYSQAGTPRLIIQEKYDAANAIYQLDIRQTCSATPGQPKKDPFYFPFAMALLDSKSYQICLKPQILIIHQAEQTFTFENVVEKPIPSFNRHFSAPVKIQYEETEQALACLWQYDTDGFNQWEAGQRYALSVILKNVAQYQKNNSMIISPNFIEDFKTVLLNFEKNKQDKFFLSRLLTLPSEQYIATHMSVIDVEGIYQARQFLKKQLAHALKEILLRAYHDNHTDNPLHHFTVAALGERALKNTVLDYLLALEDSLLEEKIAMSQFKAALDHNMTDTMGVLTALNHCHSPVRKKALAEFYTRWQHSPLVIDKWLSLQAVSSLEQTLIEVQSLMQQPVFDIKNPNRVYALIVAFGQRNNRIFHAKDGSGYAFIADQVLALDPINPQVAARVLQPLTYWQQHDQNRQALMKKELSRILQTKSLSSDVYEITKKGLGV